jgi:hypothetical protein
MSTRRSSPARTIAALLEHRGGPLARINIQLEF